MVKDGGNDSPCLVRHNVHILMLRIAPQFYILIGFITVFYGTESQAKEREVFWDKTLHVCHSMCDVMTGLIHHVGGREVFVVV